MNGNIEYFYCIFAIILLVGRVDGFSSSSSFVCRGVHGYRRKVFHLHASESEESMNSDSPRMRDKVKKFAKSIIVKPMTVVAPRAIADILTDATTGAVEVAKETIDDVKAGGSIQSSRAFSRILEQEAEMQVDTVEALDAIVL
jgi:hypothetical protein